MTAVEAETASTTSQGSSRNKKKGRFRPNPPCRSPWKTSATYEREHSMPVDPEPQKSKREHSLLTGTGLLMEGVDGIVGHYHSAT